ncbi:uncharacterized protein LOC134205246 isoform X2 [Armigeres subalbatus]|uniref:uncharacterized protein LOC134205246 isoform X2 n=1 Tax=Armigeres subalbatus TaxID=124917 RepID=UPI002ED0B09D
MESDLHDLTGESLMSTVDDILFVTSRHNEQAMMWVNHLKTCFDKITKQRGRLPFNFLHVKIDEDQITHQLAHRCQFTKLQIVIVCPTLLSLSSQFLQSNLKLLLKPERVLGMLLDVAEGRVWEIHKTTFPAYNKWRTCVVGDHEQSFVSELLGIATDILGRALRQQPLLSSDVANVVASPKAATAASHSTTGHQEAFTLFPRKVKVGQSKIIAILNEPMVKDDWIKIKIEKANEIIEITNIKRRNPYTIQFNIPESCMEISMMIGIRVEKNSIDLGCRPLKCESRLRELEQILKSQDAPMDFLCQSIGIAISDRDKLDTYLLHSFQRNIPPNFHLLNSVDAGEGLKTHRETNPEEYPTLLHFAAYWGLEKLCLQLMDCPGGDVACEMRNISGRTPADLAEIGSHFKLANSFKNFSQMHEFTTMYHYFKGISEASPNKIVIEPKSSSTKSANNTKESLPIVKSAPHAGSAPRHPHHQSEGYMEMNGSGSDIESSQCEGFNSVSNLNYLNVEALTGGGHDEVDFVPIDSQKQLEKDKEILNNLNSSHDVSTGREHEILFNELRITEPEYFESSDINKSDTFSQECSNLLENCNVYCNNEFDYLIQPSNLPVRNAESESDYSVQPSNIPIHEYSNFDFGNEYQNNPSNKQINVNQEAGREISHLRLSFKKKDQDSDCKPKSSTLKRQESNSSKKSVDDELLEIITDFKNNVFTIQEVEQLVDSWKSRNDVQKSFKDKAEQLQRMREEYERIQQQMKEKLKRPTPFERMKKMFTKSKHTPSKKVNAIATTPSDVCDDIKFSMLSPTSNSHRPVSSTSLQSISSGSSGRMSTLSGASVGDSGTHSDSDERKFGFVNKDNNRSSLMDNYMIPPAPRPVITPAGTPTPVEEKDRPCFSSAIANEHYCIFPSNIPVFQEPYNDYVNTPCSLPLNRIDETKESENQVQPIKIQRHEIIYSQLENVRPTLSSFRTSLDDSQTSSIDEK